MNRRRTTMTRVLRFLLPVAGALAIAGCVVYEPVAVSQPAVTQRYDRSWSAAAGAMADAGLTITAQDRGAGIIRGERGGTTITAMVQTLADGRIQVKFDSKGPGGADADLVQRVSDNYERRMGR
jgi:hypothetical protein